MEAIKPSELGFINAKTNQLRSKEELKPLDENKSPQSSDTSGLSNDTSVTSSLVNEKARVSSDINSFANVLNQNIGNLKSAKKNIKQLRRTAKDLKKAIKNGDNESADKLREKFSKLQSERDSLSEQIKVDNRDTAGSRNTVVTVGNSVRARLRTDAVKFDKSQEVDLSSTKGINQFLKASKQDLQSIKTQIKDDKAIRKVTRELNSSIRNELNSLGTTSDALIGQAINGIEEAGIVANDIAAQIGSQKTLEESIVSNVDRLVADNLLK